MDANAHVLSDQRELDLTPERLPRTIWLAAAIPILTAALLWWLTSHWQELSYRGYADDPDWLWRRSAYESMVRGILLFLAFEMWLVAYGVAHWYGSPRTIGRVERFNVWIANAWFVALWIPAIQLGITLDLSWRGVALCSTLPLVGLAILVFAATRARNEATAVRASRFAYYNRQDPALVSARGINLGNPWQWALLAAGLLPSLVILLLLWIQRR